MVTRVVFSLGSIPHSHSTLTIVTKKVNPVPLDREGRLEEVIVWIQIPLQCPLSHLPHDPNPLTRPSHLAHHLNSFYPSPHHLSPLKTSTEQTVCIVQIVPCTAPPSWNGLALTVKLVKNLLLHVLVEEQNPHNDIDLD